MGNNSNGGFPTQIRQLGGGVSFAQSLGGSQLAAPLDLSYVLSNNRHIAFIIIVAAIAMSYSASIFVPLRPVIAEAYAISWRFLMGDRRIGGLV